MILYAANREAFSALNSVEIPSGIISVVWVIGSVLLSLMVLGLAVHMLTWSLNYRINTEVFPGLFLKRLMILDA